MVFLFEGTGGGRPGGTAFEPVLLLRISGDTFGDELVLGLGTGLERDDSCWPVSFPGAFCPSCCEVDVGLGTRGGTVPVGTFQGVKATTGMGVGEGGKRKE